MPRHTHHLPQFGTDTQVSHNCLQFGRGYYPRSPPYSVIQQLFVLYLSNQSRNCRIEDTKHPDFIPARYIGESLVFYLLRPWHYITTVNISFPLLAVPFNYCYSYSDYFRIDFAPLFDCDLVIFTSFLLFWCWPWLFPVKSYYLLCYSPSTLLYPPPPLICNIEPGPIYSPAVSFSVNGPYVHVRVPIEEIMPIQVTHSFGLRTQICLFSLSQRTA